MRYHALATDYDGTIARDGVVPASTLDALRRLRDGGRRLILVTGRELPELRRVLPELPIFDRVVAENGALLHDPKTGAETVLGEAPPEPFVAALRSRGVSPLSVGRAIVATFEPHDRTVLEAIRDLGLELQVIFNKGAVMVLPSGVNKASGLEAALRDLGLSRHEVVAVGDAENDHALLDLCECGVAVANAVPGLRERADWVTRGARGEGVEELVERLLAGDLADVPLERRGVPLGEVDGPGEPEALRVPARDAALLVAGPAGSGKSRLVSAFLRALGEADYQFCVVDPEGDYGSLPKAVVLGGADRAPAIREIREVLERPDASAVVNLLGVALAERGRFFAELAAELAALRAKTGRPHWLVAGEAHALVPQSWTPPGGEPFRGSLWVTGEPERLARAALESVDRVVGVGPSAAETVAEVASVLGRPVPALDGPRPSAEEAVAWRLDAPAAPVRFRFVTAKEPPRRDRRKHLEGSLGDDRAFWFRGPAGRLKLKAQNVELFLQIAEGVDDETWLFHLRRGDYSRWFRTALRDDDLAESLALLEGREDLDGPASREQVLGAVRERYGAGSERR